MKEGTHRISECSVVVNCTWIFLHQGIHSRLETNHISSVHVHGTFHSDAALHGASGTKGGKWLKSTCESFPEQLQVIKS